MIKHANKYHFNNEKLKISGKLVLNDEIIKKLMFKYNECFITVFQIQDLKCSLCNTLCFLNETKKDVKKNQQKKLLDHLKLSERFWIDKVR